MSATDHYLGVLEDRFERLSLQFQSLLAQVQSLATQIAGLQSSAGGGNQGGGVITYYIDPIVISAGSSQTGLTIYTLIGGSLTATGTTNATVYNGMASATVATSGKNIIVGPNPDGTWSTITQSC